MLVLVNPEYPQRRKSWFGIGPDPLIADRRPSIIFWPCVMLLLPVVAVASGTDGDLPTGILILTLFAIGAAVVAGVWTRAERAAAWVVVPNMGIFGSRSADLYGRILAARDAGLRFRALLADRPAVGELAQMTEKDVAVALWLAVARLTEIQALEAQALAMGSTPGGTSKTAYRRALEERLPALAEPIDTSTAQVIQLAELAEEVVYSEALALAVTPTVDVAAPSGADLHAKSSMEDAARILSTWASAWKELDVRLRAIAIDLECEKNDMPPRSTPTGPLPLVPGPPAAVPTRDGLRPVVTGEHTGRGLGCLVGALVWAGLLTVTMLGSESNSDDPLFLWFLMAGIPLIVAWNEWSKPPEQKHIEATTPCPYCRRAVASLLPRPNAKGQRFRCELCQRKF